MINYIPPQSGGGELDPDLDTIADLDAGQSGVIASDGAGWLRKTYAALKTSLSLDNVDNTADADKPVSTAQATAIGLKQDSSDELTAIAGLTPSNDDFLQRKAGAWSNRTVAQVKSDLALSNVDNTTDANKPVSSAQLALIRALRRDPADGEAVLERLSAIDGNSSMALGTIGLTYFVAQQTITIASMRMFCTTAHTGSPTLERMGIYNVDQETGALTSVAGSTANDTALFGSTGARTKALTTPAELTAGTIYAAAAIQVGGDTGAKFSGSYMGSSDESGVWPWVFAGLGSQTDLPATGSPTAQSYGYQFHLIYEVE